MNSRIVVLNYNGADLLRQFLPSVVESAAASSFSCKVSVLDNQSTDESVTLLKREFPGVDIFLASKNKVLCSYNEAAAFYGEDVLIFLNNDIKPEKNFIDPLLQVFTRHSDAFFAATYGDRALPVRRWGSIAPNIHYDGFEYAIMKNGYSFSAGIGAFDRKKFLELGGYDEMYLPGYYEDVDFCYRGWKRGYRGYYEPQSRQYHVGGASFSKAYKQNDLQRIVFRNSLLFMIKNVTDPLLLAGFFAGSVARIIKESLLGHFYVFEGFLETVKRLPKALSSRRQVKSLFKFTDRYILKFIHEDICVKI